MTENITADVLVAQNDRFAMDVLLADHSAFIKKCASKNTGRFVTESDDEYSIAMIALSEAVKNFSPQKGDFYPFAANIIKLRLVDYYRSQHKYTVEMPASPEIFNSEQEEQNMALHNEINQKLSYCDDTTIAEEIESINIAFARYGFEFMDLAECSPKADKTRAACGKAVRYILKNPIIISEIQTQKQLPLKIIEKNAGVPRKILERHRKYLIAAVEILGGEYPFLAEYMRPLREE